MRFAPEICMPCCRSAPSADQRHSEILIPLFVAEIRGKVNGQWPVVLYRAFLQRSRQVLSGPPSLNKMVRHDYMNGIFGASFWHVARCAVRGLQLRMFRRGDVSWHATHFAR